MSGQMKQMCTTASYEALEKMSSSKGRRNMKRSRENSFDPLVRQKIPTTLILQHDAIWGGRFSQNGEQAD